MKRTRIKVYLCNTNTLHAQCGFGTGWTLEEAIEAAKKRVRDEYGVEGYYHNGMVCFSGGVNC